MTSPGTSGAGRHGRASTGVVRAEASGAGWAPDPGAPVRPSQEDGVVAAASTFVGGPAGRRLATLGGPRWVSAATVLVMLAFCLVGVGIVEKQHCRAQGWTSPDHFWHACYADTAVLYASGGLGESPRFSLGHALGPDGLEQSPLAGTAMYVVSSLVPDPDAAPGQGDGPRRFFDLSALVLAVALGIGTALLVRAGGRRPWDAAHLALSPILVTVGVMSYELLPVTLICAALLAWTRRHMALAALAVAVAMLAAPAYAVVALAMGLVGVRSGRWRAGVGGGVVAIGLWLGARQLFPGVPGLVDAWRAWHSAAPGYGSIWLVPQLLGEARPRRARWWFDLGALDPNLVTVLLLVAMVVLFVTVAALVLIAPAPRLAPVALVLLAVVLITARNLPVQASLLLLPLIALSGLKWRDHLIWAFTELVYFVGVWLYIGGQTDTNRGLSPELYLTLLLARLAGIGWIAFQALRVIREPELVRAAEPEPEAVDNDSVNDGPGGYALPDPVGA